MPSRRCATTCHKNGFCSCGTLSGDYVCACETGYSGNGINCERKYSFIRYTIEEELKRRATRVGNFEVFVPGIVHVHYVSSGQSIAFFADENAELAVPPLFWPVNCINIGGQVALPTSPTFYSLYK